MYQQIRRALISTTHTQGLVEFVSSLLEFDIEILATAGSAQLLRQNHLTVTDISEYTGCPEILGGRLKTLHSKIYAGLLRRPADHSTLDQYDIKPIDLLVVNLYRFSDVVAVPDCSLEQAIEHIDVGGPSMLRAAAKNHALVTVVFDPKDYSLILHEMKRLSGQTMPETRQRLAQKTFAYLADYDSRIAQYLAFQQSSDTLAPASLSFPIQQKRELRYGENPHQWAALYECSGRNDVIGLAQAQQHQGKEMSFNNWLDAHCAYRCVYELSLQRAGCVIVKHGTPCGVASADTLRTAYRKAYMTDPDSAFGGIIAVNRVLDVETARTIIEQPFVEIIIAPRFDERALALLKRKPRCRLLAVSSESRDRFSFSYHAISGGLLVQEEDRLSTELATWEVVSQRQPTRQEWEDLTFAWAVVKHVKSNAIVLAKEQATLGLGSGQTSRVFSVKIALMKAAEAKLSIQEAVMASDAFFPFSDSIALASEAGIGAVIQPGGSKRDSDVIQAVDQANMVMVLTHRRHFRH